MKALLSFYRSRYAMILVYMLQNVEYRPGPYLAWFWRTQDFDSVMKRRSLDRTVAARLLLIALQAGMFLQASVGIGLIVLWFWVGLPAGWQFGLALLLSYPIVWAHLIAIPLAVGDVLIVRPRQRTMIRSSEKVFAKHDGIRVAVLGSYGKTTMKELLSTVLAEGRKVSATPGNKNVSISHARFAQTLDGDEDVLVIEYGEGRPGDVGRFARQTHPTHAVITGLAPAHLDRYKNIDNVAKDLFSIGAYVEPAQVYVNADAEDIMAYAVDGMSRFDAGGALGWTVSDVKLDADGTKFVLKNGQHRLKLASSLVGGHNVGPLAFVAAFALEIGLCEDQVVVGIAKTVPFEHRMQPRRMNGAVVIDDTYNGNLQGIRAGTELLGELQARRKWYVSPGLVDQGAESDSIHRQMGELIAAAKPDIVVLMANSAQAHIAKGLAAGGFGGELRIEHDPLKFYNNLPHLVAAGDLVLMQNDWTDNYA